MHHYPRYVIPGFTAAALHAVLLFGVKPPCRTAPPPVVEPKVVLRPFPPELLAAMRPETPEAKPAQPASRGGPSSPELPEMPREAMHADFIVPRIERSARVEPARYQIPKQPGGDGGDAHGDWSIGTPKIINVGDLDRMPRAKVQVAPDYPVPLRQSGTGGTVTVEFDVDATGRVVSARVLRSTERGFEEATLRAVLKWRFEPGRRDGRAVPFRMSVPVDFRLGAD